MSTRDIPVYQRNKSSRSWIDEEGYFLFECYYEDPVHFIKLFSKVDKSSRKIMSVEIDFIRCPYPEYCPLSSEVYQNLIGLKIQSGFNSTIKEIIAKEKGCVHIQELLRELGDSLVQSFFYLNIGTSESESRRKELRKRGLKNICLAYSDEYNQE